MKAAASQKSEDAPVDGVEDFAADEADDVPAVEDLDTPDEEPAPAVRPAKRAPAKRKAAPARV